MQNSKMINSKVIQSGGGRTNNLQKTNYQHTNGHSRQTIPGQSRIEYIPYEKTIIQYEPITKIQYIPREKKVVQYYPVQYQTEYVPQVYHEKVIEYVPVERLQQRVQYIPVQRQIYHPPQEEPYDLNTNQAIYKGNNTSWTPPVYHPINPSSSRMQYKQQEQQGGNISFQGQIQYPAPHNNSYYTKQPLPSSKRQYL